MATRERRDLDVNKLEREYPGADADTPTEVPPKGWWQIIRRGYKEFNTDQMGLIAAGVAFYAFLAIVPTLIAVTFIYGLVTSPHEVKTQIAQLSQSLPKDASALVGNQMLTLATANRSGLGIGAVVSVLFALFSASGATNNLITAVNDAYDERETRNILKRRGLALLLTLGAIVAFITTTTLIAVFPAVSNALNLSGVLLWGLEALRWVLVLLVVLVALAVLYRVAPDRDDPQLKWATPGAVVATVVWIVASIVFSLYVSHFNSYGKTYGALAGIVVLLMWLWLTIYAVLLGAEINAEAEKQTIKDTTTGPEKPLGERNATKADLTPADTDPDQGGSAHDEAASGGGRGDR